MVGGVITVPSSPGDVSVTGLGPVQSVVFMGTNFLTEDAIVTATGTGLFRGMIAPKFDDPGTLYQNAASIALAGDAHNEDDYAILMIDTAGLAAELYRATVTLDPNGFTASFDIAASGGYKVVYMALVNYDNMASIYGGSATETLGFKAESSLLHGAWGGPVISGTDRTQECYGGGAYPGGASGGWRGPHVTSFTFPTSAGQQFFIEKAVPAGGTVGFGGHFTGPFLITGSWNATPQGVGLEDFGLSFDSGNDAGLTMIWDGASYAGFVTPGPDEDDVTTVTGLPFAPGAVITYSLSAENGGQSSGAAVGAVGLSVTTPDFHWCATIDGFGFGGMGRGAYQSFQRDWVANVNGTQVHAGTMVLTDDGFVTTTEEDSADGKNLVWHAFGYPRTRMAMVPQIYRRRVA